MVDPIVGTTRLWLLSVYLGAVLTDHRARFVPTLLSAIVSLAACRERVIVPGPPASAAADAPPPTPPAVPTAAVPESPATVQTPAPAESAPRATTPAGPATWPLGTALAPPNDCTSVPPIKLTPVASGFEQPLYVTSPRGDARLFVVEKAGRIRIVKDGVTQPTPFLDIHEQVFFPAPNAEGGLLGLAFHPDYEKNGRFWLHYSSAPKGNVVVAELKRQNADSASPTIVKTLVDTKHGAWNHVGGMLAFGRDGFLYDGIGDAAQSPSAAPDLSSKLGKILRFDVDAFPRPAPGNVAGPEPHIWDYGLRNPWRFSFDRLTGDLYIGDVGARNWEEIDVEPARTGKRDYGWDRVEGTHCFPAGTSCTPRGIPPVAEHPHNDAASIIGGYVYRGAKIPCLRGRYVYGDYGTGRFFSFVWNGTAAEKPVELTAQLRPNGLPASFGEDDAGELYVVMFNTGKIFRIEPR